MDLGQDPDVVKQLMNIFKTIYYCKNFYAISYTHTYIYLCYIIYIQEASLLQIDCHVIIYIDIYILKTLKNSD